MDPERFGISPQLKLDVMFEGIRYTEALGEAADHSLPNYYPYRFKPGETDPTGEGKVTIPYLINLPDGTLIRILGNGESGWAVDGDRGRGYTLRHDDRHDAPLDIAFEPQHRWMHGKTSDGFPMARAGVSTHNDMLVVNVAPGCEFFLHKHDGVSMRCRFCSYGAPDERTAHLGQVAGQVDIPATTLARTQEAIEAVIAETEIRHIYLVGGSLTDGAEEGRRFLQLARAVREVNAGGVPVTLGSGAIPEEQLREFHEERLVDAVCFNLEVWSEPLFARVCPGKHRYVGYSRWIEALENAVGLWGRGRVYSAMVAGIELEPEYGMDWQEAADTAIAGAHDLCERGILPIYSLYWPVGGRDRTDYQSSLRRFFERLNLAYYDIRKAHGLEIWEGFMCHRCAYMQLECDLEHGARSVTPGAQHS